MSSLLLGRRNQGCEWIHNAALALLSACGFVGSAQKFWEAENLGPLLYGLADRNARMAQERYVKVTMVRAMDINANTSIWSK